MAERNELQTPLPHKKERPANDSGLLALTTYSAQVRLHVARYDQRAWKFKTYNRTDCSMAKTRKNHDFDKQGVISGRVSTMSRRAPASMTEVLRACGLSACIHAGAVDAALPFLTRVSQSSYPDALIPCLPYFRQHGFGVLLHRDLDPFDEGQELAMANHVELLRELRIEWLVTMQFARPEEYTHARMHRTERLDFRVCQ